MPAETSPNVTILTAGRGNGSRPTEDRIFTSNNAVIVLDGASQPEPSPYDGGWIANELGSELIAHLTVNSTIDLAHALESTIRSLVTKYDLQPGSAPSTTVSVVRWDEKRVDILVLCDSPVAIMDREGVVRLVRDDRLAEIGKEIRRPPGFRTSDPTLWRELVARQRRQRNNPGGYWVAEATPEAAHQAIRAQFDIGDIAIILAMTDGVSAGVDRYGIPPGWKAAFELAAEDPERLVDMIDQAERSDPKGERWPRSKCHDDKALAVIRFN